ncbi:MAG: hypothetical protein HRT54_06510 [Colwellia sp.]|nr:hypothetical protein [Colwellia sp.]
MNPWLLVAELMCATKTPFSKLVAARINKYPASGEINNVIEDPKAARVRVLYYYDKLATNMNYADSISIEFENWRFNLRSSNT